MNRNNPLRSKARLTRSTPLTGGAGLARRGGLSRRPAPPRPASGEPAGREEPGEASPAPPRPSRPSPPRRRSADTGPPRRVRDAVFARDGGLCVVCGRDVTAGGWNLQHRRPRGTGGTRDPAANSPANLIVVCGTGTTGCHGRIESRREWAEQLGYLVRRGVTGPADRPVLVAGVGWMLLDHDGGRRRAPGR